MKQALLGELGLQDSTSNCLELFQKWIDRNQNQNLNDLQQKQRLFEMAENLEEKQGKNKSEQQNSSRAFGTPTQR